MRKLDPTMTKMPPPEALQAIEEVLGFRNRPTPIELWDAIREAVLKAQAQERHRP